MPIKQISIAFNTDDSTERRVFDWLGDFERGSRKQYLLKLILADMYSKIGSRVFMSYNDKLDLLNRSYDDRTFYKTAEKLIANEGLDAITVFKRVNELHDGRYMMSYHANNKSIRSYTQQEIDFLISSIEVTKCKPCSL